MIYHRFVDRQGWPFEEIEGRPVQTFVRFLIQMAKGNLRRKRHRS